MMNAEITTRIEKDLIGYREINNNDYYGVQTLRALENFNLIPKARSEIFLTLLKL